MRIEFYEYVLTNKFKNGIQYKKSIFLFLERYTILEEELSTDALTKSFQRWRGKCKE